MQELTVTETEQVNGAGGGVHVGSDGADNVVTPLGGGVRVGSDGANNVVTPLGGRIDPGGANTLL